MITHLLRLFLVFRLVLATVVMQAMWPRGMPTALFAAILVFGAYEVLLLPRFGLLLWVNRGQNVRPPELTALIRAWWRESLSFERTFSWYQPFAAEKFVDTCAPKTAAGGSAQALGEARRGVLLLHGYGCNRGLWNDWMATLEAVGHPCVALSLTPAGASIDAHTAAIDLALRDLERAGGLPPLIVAHSMGGLVARAWWRQHGTAFRVHRIVTLGTPHRGTLTARLGPTLNARQMRLHSDWLQALVAHSPAGLSECMICYYSNADQTVCPTDAAVLPGSVARLKPGLGHLGLLTDREVMAEVLAELAPQSSKTLQRPTALNRRARRSAADPAGFRPRP